MSDRFDGSGNFKAAEIRTAKNISSVRRRRSQPDVYRDGCVQANTISFYS
jgi:hypothetical protein